MDGQFEGKVVAITGAASGIGREAARLIARRGGTVVVLDRDAAGAGETLRLIEEAGDEAAFVEMDLASGRSIADAMREIGARWGKLDVLVNNGAVVERTLVPEGQKTTIEHLPEEFFDTIVNVNFKSVWLCTRHAIPLMRAVGGGAIVNAGSTGGMVAYTGGAVYGSLKAAVIMLTRNMATELSADNIRVNCYCPSAIDTPFAQKIQARAADPAKARERVISPVLMKRLGKAEEVARVICFLASDESSYVTGSAVVVDGGTLAWRGHGEPPV